MAALPTDGAGDATAAAAAAVEEEKKDEVDSSLPSVMILGGCGFIGRHLVQLLVSQRLARVIVVDKRAPFTSYFTKAMLALYKDPLVTQLQCDLSRPDLVDKKKLFDRPLDYIVNLCGETRFGQSDLDYETKCVKTAQLCVDRVKSMTSPIQKWIEVSTAQVYKSQKSPAAKEASKLDPWTRLAAARLKAENIVKDSGIPYVILRPSIVYGPADKTGLTPRLVCGACYKHAKEKMVFLWQKTVQMNTVHVRDVSSAIWTCCTSEAVSSGKIYNLSDKGSTTAGDLNGLLQSIFGIKCDFQSSAMNAVAKRAMGYAAKVSNDKHMPMWAEACKAGSVTDTPLSPFLDEEILTKNHMTIDGSLIESEAGFKYKIPSVTVEFLQEVVNEYVEQKYFPALSMLGV